MVPLEFVFHEFFIAAEWKISFCNLLIFRCLILFPAASTEQRLTVHRPASPEQALLSTHVPEATGTHYIVHVITADPHLLGWVLRGLPAL